MPHNKYPNHPSNSDKVQYPAASYQQTISPEERKSVSLLAYSIKKAAEEVRTATSNHTHAGRLADDFLTELSQDEA